MLTREPQTTYDMARRFASEVRGDPDARELRFRYHRDVSQLWLVTDPVDLQAEKRFYELSHVLYVTFPQALIDFHVVNAASFEPFDVDDIVPNDAEHLQLRES